MKKLATLGITAILVIFTFIACNKDKGNFKIEGTAFDVSLGQTLSGATVKIYQTPAGTGLKEHLATTTTDALGNYSFSFKREKMEKYTIVISKALYFDKSIDIPFSSMSLEEAEVIDIETTAKSWVKIHLNNLNPQSSDVLDYTKQNGKVDCEECCSAGMQSFSGPLDSTFYCINDGNTVYSFLYSTNSIGSGIKTITTVPFDTVDLELQY